MRTVVSHRRQVILFLAAVCIPYLILIVLSIKVIGQDRELREVRRADRQRQVLGRVRRELLARLEGIKRDEIRTELRRGERYRHPEVVLVAWVVEDRLTLPWETGDASRRSRETAAGPFEAKIRECEHTEFGFAQPAAAARCYGQSAGTAKSPEQAAYARLLEARALTRAGRPKQARTLFRMLLQTDPAVTDEDDIPLALYAAHALAQAGVEPRKVIGTVREVLAARPWSAPASCFLASEIADRVSRTADGAEEVRHAVSGRVRLAEQAQSLAADLPRLGLLRPGAAGPVWAAYGDDMWLAGAAPREGGRIPLIVVRARDVLEPFETRHGMRFADSRETRGEALGDTFPGLKAVFEGPDDPPLQRTLDLQRRLYYFALLLIASATMFGGYLLWRDLRRDLRLSELRAQFVSSVSHELKTPLTAIRMLAETLQMGRVKDTQTQEEYLDTITNECERLSRLVDEVLLFSKIEQGKKVYRFRPVRLEETVQAAARAMEYPLRQKGFRLRLDLEAGLPAIKADEDALEQALLNLLSNAMKYSGDSREIEVGLARGDGGVAVRVTDHGIGIAPEQQTRIFEGFYRAPTRENQLIPGTGLGLTLVAQIAKAHGGQVAVESAPGKGSTFSIRLPMEESV